MFRTVCLILSLLFFITGCAEKQEKLPLQAGDSEHYAQFVSYVEEVSAQFALAPPRVLMDRNTSLWNQRWKPAEVYVVGSLSQYSDRPASAVPHEIRATLYLMRHASPLAQKFAAAHEVCHVRYGRTLEIKTRRFSSAEMDVLEIEANRCACEYLGKNSCVTAIMELSQFVDLFELQGEKRAYVERWIRKRWSVK